jgi:hypothetical protein
MPYAEYGLTYDFQIIVQTAQGLRPSVPDGAPLDLVKIFQICVDPVPAKRPDATSVAAMLKVRYLFSKCKFPMFHFIVNYKAEEDYKKDPKSFLANSYKAPKKEESTVPATITATAAKPAFAGWGKKEETPAEPKKAGFSGWGKKDDGSAPTSPPPVKKEELRTSVDANDKFPGWGGMEDKSDDETSSKKSDGNGVKRAGASKGPKQNQVSNRK